MRILIASHRRSGTHLTIDSISNNAKSIFELNSFDLLRKNDQDLKGLSVSNNSDDILYKSHVNGLKFNEYMNLVKKQDIKIIYVYRDGRDVMQSLYNYESSSIAFKDFIYSENKYENEEYEGKLNRLEYWAFHVQSWLNSNVDLISVQFSDLTQDFPGSMVKIFKSLDLEYSEKLIDTRQKNKLQYYFKKYILKKNITTVKFSKGQVGTYEKYFDEDLNNYYKKILKEYSIDKYFKNVE